MKRIGILTYHCIPNFGAQLQALSTIGYLRKHGYEPIVINWYPYDLEEYYSKRVSKEQNKAQFEFSQEFMPVSRLCQSFEELNNEIERLNLQAIIIGSDALFDYTPEKYRYNYSLRKLKKIPIYITSNHRLPNPFWGSFNDSINKHIPLYGFSISSQNSPYKDLNREERKELRRLLNGFELITVRDEWTKKFVEEVGRLNNINITPDPVFAFNQNYINILSKEEILKKYELPDKYILISFMYSILSNEFINNIIHKTEDKTKCKCVSFPMPEGLRTFDTKYKINLPLNPVDWYAIIKYSEGYIGERMHPIIVCLHNYIPFYCFDQYGAIVELIPRIWSKFIPESSKVYDILKQAGIIANSSFYSKLNNITTDYVVERFMNFPIKQCEEFSTKQLNNYNSGMGLLINQIG